MKKCYFTYKMHSEPGNYSAEGLKLLHAKLSSLAVFPFDHQEQMKAVQGYSGKISIQGIQPKLSAKLSLKEKSFKLTEVGGTYILKPQVDGYLQLPENEDLTMHLARMAKLTVPWHGLLVSKDNSLLYAIKRFDRIGHGRKLLQEDFAQLINATRTTKYQANMERVATVVEEFCTFPRLETPKLFRLIIFSFLVGNEDLHMKNFSLQISQTGTVKLSPVYDLLNTTIALVHPEEELALSLNDKKRGFHRKDFIDYYAVNFLSMTKAQADTIVNELIEMIPLFIEKVEQSFLNEDMKQKYIQVLRTRAERLS